ncbi:MAG: DUF2723 domain-containing protein [Patescibacteria group bacterium]
MIYLTTVSAYPTGYADSDELITTGYFGGVSHPPGYPLFTLLTFFSTHLPIPGSVALRANLLSALLQALSLGFVYLTALILIKLVFKRISQTIQQLAAVIGTLTLGFSFLYWNYANLLEVFSLHIFFTTILLFLTTKVIGRKSDPKYLFKIWLFFSIVLGLAMAHHQTIVLLLPGLFLFWLPLFVSFKPKLHFHNLKTFLLGITTALVSFLMSYTLLFIFQVSDSPVSWYFKPTLTGLWEMITRKDYAGITTVDGTETRAYLTGFYLPENFQSLKLYLTHFLPNHFGILSLTLMAVGCISLIKQRVKNLRWGILLLLGLSCLFPAFYLTFPTDSSATVERFQITGLTERMYLMGYVILGVLISVGIAAVFNTYSHIRKFAFLFFIIPLQLLVSNYYEVNLKNYSSTSGYAQSVLANLEPDSVLVCFSDISCFSLFYEQSVNKNRTDVAIIPITVQLQKNYQNLSRFSYKQNPQRIGDIISWSVKQGKPVYLVEVSGYIIEQLGLDGEVFYLQPNGYTYKVVCTPPTEISEPDYTLSIILATNTSSERQHLQLAFRYMIGRQHLGNGIIFARMRAKTAALKELTLAQKLLPENSNVETQVKNLAFYEGDKRYLTPSTCKTAQDFLEKLKYCDVFDKQCRYTNLFRATLAEPTNVYSRLELAAFYEENRFSNLARKEYENILSLDAHHLKARQKLQELEASH